MRSGITATSNGSAAFNAATSSRVFSGLSSTGLSLVPRPRSTTPSCHRQGRAKQSHFRDVAQDSYPDVFGLSSAAYAGSRYEELNVKRLTREKAGERSRAAT